MPSTRTKLPSYRHHKPSGQAVVTLSGRDVYLGPHGTRLSRENYDRVVGEWLAAGRAMPKNDDSPAVTVVELVNAFHKAGAIPASHDHSYKSVMKLLVRLYGRTSAGEFGPLALKVVRNAMVSAGWNRTTINNRVHMLRRIFRWGVEHEMIPADVPQALDAVEGFRIGKTTAPESEAVHPVAVEHVEATLSAMSPTVRAMVRLQLLTGMRAGELCQMRTGDIDATGPVWVYRPERHKTQHHNKTRDVAIGPKAIEILRPLLRPDLAAYIFNPAETERARRETLTFARKTPAGYGNRPGSNRKRRPERTPGDHYTTPSYRRAIYRACDKAFPLPPPLARRQSETIDRWKARLTPAQRVEIAKWRDEHRWHPHQLRHTFADQVRRAFGLDHAQKALGHANANMTERYAQVALEKAVEVAQAIG